MIRLRDVMARDVVTVSPESTLREVLGVLRSENVTGAPVVQGNRVVGVVSVADVLDFEIETPAVPTERPGQVEWGGLEEVAAGEEEGEEEDPGGGAIELWDDVGADVVERFAQDAGPEWDLLSEHVVSEVMTMDIVRLPPDTELDVAGRHMLQHGVHRLLVMEDDRLLGIVTSTDFVRAVSQRRV